MLKTTKKSTSTLVIASLIGSSLIGVGFATPASAEGCQGVNERNQIASDFDNTQFYYETKMDSCKTQQLYDAATTAGAVGTLGGLAATAGIFSGVLGPAAGLVGSWALNNTSGLQDCMKDGKGVKFTETNGAIGSCTPQ